MNNQTDYRSPSCSFPAFSSRNPKFEQPHFPNTPTTESSQREEIKTPRSIWIQVLEALLAFAVFGCLVAVPLVTPPLTKTGTYNSTQRTVYTTIATIIGTLITGFVIDGIRSLYLYHVDDQLSTYPQSEARLKKQLDKQWQTILGLASWKSFNFRTKVVLLVGALLTTCITSGLTPTTTTRAETFTPKIPSSDPYVFAKPWDAATEPSGEYWDIHNGSRYSVWVMHGGSPFHRAFKLMDGININDPSLYAYADNGVAIQSEAIGAPVTTYNPDHIGYGLSETLNQYKWNVNAVSTCAPVMIRNPVKCHPGGMISWPNNGKVMQVTSDDGSCNATYTSNKANPKTDNVVIIYRLCPTGDVGQTKVIFGAVSGPQTIAGYSHWLAQSIGVDLGKTNPGQTYSIECDIDARDVFRYRNVTFQVSRALSSKPNDDGNSQNLVFDRVLSAGEACTPPGNPSISKSLGATVAYGSFFSIYEIRSTGWFQSIVNVVSRTGDYGVLSGDAIRRPPFAFNNSVNPLEDVLGLVGALAVSRSVLNMSLVPSIGSAEVVFTRVGSGKLFSLVYATVPLLLGIIMVIMLVRTEGKEGIYKSRSLRDLIRFGAEH